MVLNQLEYRLLHTNPTEHSHNIYSRTKYQVRNQIRRARYNTDGKTMVTQRSKINCRYC